MVRVRSRVAAKTRNKPDLARIVRSFHELATQLAYRAYAMAQDTNDLGHYHDADLDVFDLWTGYWQQSFQQDFLSAFYGLSSELREQREIRKLVATGAEVFYATLDRRAKQARGPRPRSTLIWFDGTKERPLVRKARGQISKLVTRDRASTARVRRRAPAEDVVTLESVLGVRVGDPYRDLVAILGKPSAERRFETSVFPVWRDLGLQVGVTAAGAAIMSVSVCYDARTFRSEIGATKQVAVSTSTLKTDKGIGAGSTAAEVVTAYGKPRAQGRFVEDKRRHHWLRYGKTTFFRFIDGVLAQIEI